MTPEELPFGVYEHYKGETYEVISVAQHSETLEKMVRSSQAPQGREAAV